MCSVNNNEALLPGLIKNTTNLWNTTKKSLDQYEIITIIHNFFLQLGSDTELWRKNYDRSAQNVTNAPYIEKHWNLWPPWCKAFFWIQCSHVLFLDVCKQNRFSGPPSLSYDQYWWKPIGIDESFLGVTSSNSSFWACYSFQERLCACVVGKSKMFALKYSLEDWRFALEHKGVRQFRDMPSALPVSALFAYARKQRKLKNRPEVTWSFPELPFVYSLFIPLFCHTMGMHVNS